MIDKASAVDNDAIIKLARYSLLDAVWCNGASVPVYVLGQSRYVVRDAIRRDSRCSSPDEAIEKFESFLTRSEELELTEDDVALATKIEDAALLANVQVDTGESQLCAVVVNRVLELLVTGDKRAIGGLYRLREQVAEINGLMGKIACLEQLVRGLLASLGPGIIKERVCSDPGADRALAICFSCATGASPDIGSVRSALTSYIDDLDQNAPGLLCGL